MKTSRQLWIIQLIVTCYLHTTVECRHYERCSTRESRTGVCVLKRFCRMASAFPNVQHTRCPGPEELLCCPLPTPNSSPAPNSIYRVTTPGSIRPSSSLDRQNSRVKPANLPLTSDDGDRKQQENPTGVLRPSPSREGPPYWRPPGDKYSREQEKRPVPSITRPELQDDRRFTSMDAEREQRQPNRPKISTPTRVRPLRNPPTDRNSTDSIKFSESFGGSLPHPPAPACGGKPFNPFIAGGEESKEHEWPWMAAIFRRSEGVRSKTFVCGGSIINTRYILSAAHCFVYNYVVLPASLYVVSLGAHNLNQGEEYTVAKIVVHEDHSASDFFNDIALLRLASEVYFTDKIAPICLPAASMAFESFIGRMATVAGWGETAFRSRGSLVLRHVAVPVVSGEDCSSAYSRVGGAAFLARGTDHVICAGLKTGGKDACLGDSGGPLMLKMENDLWTVIGIVSLGYKCAEPDYPGVYTRVTHYLTWIYSNMKRY